MKLFAASETAHSTEFPLWNPYVFSGMPAVGSFQLSLFYPLNIPFLFFRYDSSAAAAKIIDRYTFQMATTQGLTALLKSPVLQFISTISTGSPTLANLLAAQIPVEQLPVVIGKLQMAYELFSLLNPDKNPHNFDLLALWSLLLENSASPENNAWAFGHALVEYWTQSLTVEQLRQRYEGYLKQV